MNPKEFSSSKCSSIVVQLNTLLNSNKEFSNHLSFLDIGQLGAGCDAERNAEIGDMYSRPMLWIGIYIAIASFLCVLAMVADLVHGIRNKKFWMPCKYFSLNSAFITVIAVAMKLPVDLTTPMPGYVDEEAKLISLAFMSTVIVNLMPSLASMDNKTLVANVIGLSILAITVCVNTYIQINTTLISSIRGKHPFDIYYDRAMVAYIYTGFILVVLMIMISFSIAIPGFKEIIDSKYQVKNKYLTDDQNRQPIEQYVRRYWVMAQTGSPQFMMSDNPLAFAMTVVCFVVWVLNAYVLWISTLFNSRLPDDPWRSQSPYKWSTYAIVLTQWVGVVVGFMSAMLRSCSVFEFNSGNRMFFWLLRVEDCWTKKLHDWKQRRILILSSNRRSRRLIHISKDIILTIFTNAFQKVVVFLCKVISIIVLLILPVAVLVFITCMCCCKWFKATRWFSPPPMSTSIPDDIDSDLNNYVLTVDDELEISERVRMRIFKSVNSYILKAEKKQSKNLLELIKQSTGFEGVKTFDTNQVQSLLSPLEGVNTWSLPIVTLTCIAVAIHNINKQDVENLFESVNEGLSYTHLVEESLNRGNKYVKLQKVSMALWLEVDNKSKWLGIPFSKDEFEGKKAIEIVNWFSDRAKEIVTKHMSTNQELVQNMHNRVIAANSMYLITETILHRLQSTEVTKIQLFTHLRGMIADIFSACFTNIPRVIQVKCSESAIENREESVKAAAKLLGKTNEIRKMLEARQVPLMYMDKMAYIDEWRNLSVL